MSDELKVGRIVFGSTKGRDASKLDKALQKLRNPAPGVTLVSHGWVKPCSICTKHQHAKWHEYSSGEIINPIALLEFIDSCPDGEAKDRIRGWVTFITGISWPLTGGNQPSEAIASGRNRGSEAP